jgi:hypothetical protein
VLYWNIFVQKKVIIYGFYQTFFSLLNVQHSFSKLKRILILTTKKTKALEVDEIHFLTHLINAFASNTPLTLKIINFDIMFSIRCNHTKKRVWLT